jgi:TolB-like protein/Tfp pilus assembly protein PilF
LVLRGERLVPESGGSEIAQKQIPQQMEVAPDRVAAHDVFVSYASQDAAVANDVVGALERAGIICWIAPRDVIPGTFYADAIVHAIDASKAIVLVLSKHSVVSAHVLREVERGSSKRHPVVSLRTDQARMPAGLEYFLNTSQWLDASTGGTESALPKLVSAVRFAIQASTGTTLAAAPLSPTETPPARSSNRAAIAVASVATLAIAGFAADRLWLSRHRASPTPTAASSPTLGPAVPAIPEKSVAVLPFVDMSEKKDQEYFSDGLTEELIDRLAHSPDLKVIARTSSFHFKGTNEDVRTIGSKLAVANLLEGSVRTSGKRLRVTAQLIKVSDGYHLWSETYDRKMDDIFRVQDSIADAVTTAMKAAIATEVTSATYRSNNLDAYAAFLRGRFFLNKTTKDDTDRALAAFREAIRLDPGYAAAWVGIGETYNTYGMGSWMPPMKAYAEARNALDRALSINPDLAYAHHVLSNILANYQYDFAGSKAELERARQLDSTIEGDGWDALTLGQLDEGIKRFQRETQLDPLNTNAWVGLMFSLYSADRLTDAESAGRKLLELNPNAAYAHCNFGAVLLAQHRNAAALATMSEESDPDARWCKAGALWALGRRQEADALFADAKEKFAGSQAYELALYSALRNDRDETFKWLDRAYENRESEVVLIKADPAFKNFRGDPRFAELSRKMKLP